MLPVGVVQDKHLKSEKCLLDTLNTIVLSLELCQTKSFAVVQNNRVSLLYYIKRGLLHDMSLSDCNRITPIIDDERKADSSGLTS